MTQAAEMAAAAFEFTGLCRGKRGRFGMIGFGLYLKIEFLDPQAMLDVGGFEHDGYGLAFDQRDLVRIVLIALGCDFNRFLRASVPRLLPLADWVESSQHRNKRSEERRV